MYSKFSHNLIHFLCKNISQRVFFIVKVNVPMQSQVDLSPLEKSCRRSGNGTLCGNTDSADANRKVRSSGWALIQCDWCHHTERIRDTDTHEVMEAGTGSPSSGQGTPRLASHAGSQKRWGRMLPGAFRGGRALLAHWPQTPCLQAVRHEGVLFSVPEFGSSVTSALRD